MPAINAIFCKVFPPNLLFEEYAALVGRDGNLSMGTCTPYAALSLNSGVSHRPPVTGPDYERDGVVRWRCVDLQQRIKQSFGVCLHERTVGKLLHKLSFRRLSVRPQHPKSDPEAQASFRRHFRLS